jgi:putative DNA primase/helicase
MTDAATIARELGGHRTSDGFLCRCPVVSHGKGRGDSNPSLLVKNGNHAVLFKCFAGCQVSDIIEALRARWLWNDCKSSEHRQQDPVMPKAAEPAHQPDPAALVLWRTAKPIKGADVEQYLIARGITVPAPPSLRAATILHLDRYPLPAIVAAVQAPDRRIIACQVTLIDPRGDRKAQVRIPRRTVGALGWGAIRLAAADDMLGLAEGWEKALAAFQLFGIPTWSTLGAGRMHRVRVPDTVQELYIFADNDEPGRVATERTAHEHRHRRVILRFPPEQFKDWDDVTAARAKERSNAA